MMQIDYTVDDELRDNRNLLELILWKKLRRNTDEKGYVRESIVMFFDRTVYRGYYFPIYDTMNQILNEKS